MDSYRCKTMGIILALVIFGIIVTFHELGHFLLAKKSGIKVVEFSVGMGPRILSHKGKETRYSLKLLPLGGSCMMLGEDEDGMDVPGSFNAAPVTRRLATILAGPVFNFIMAFFFAMIIVANVGVDKPVITGVMDGYPASEAGIRAGDVIKKVDKESVVLYRDFLIYLQMHQGKEVDIEVIRTDGENSETLVFTVVPRFSTEHQRYLIGIESNASNKKIGNPMEIVSYSLYEVWFNITSTLKSLMLMIRGRVNANEISGPVGIVGLIGDTVEQSKSYGIWVIFLTVSNMIVLFSANLGIMNLLPIPALDGGRILFLLGEWITGKPLNRKVEGYVHFAGFALLMCFMVFIMFNDIRKLFGM